MDLSNCTLLDFTEYQENAYSTCTPACYTDEYLDYAYLAEVGELAGKMAKQIRGDKVTDKDFMQEIGDIAWTIAVKARLHGFPLIIDTRKILGPAGYFNKIRHLLGASSDAYDFKFRVLINITMEMGFDFMKCLELNNKKLKSRWKRGVIQGNGDDR